jgi:hypothetical protein
MGHEADSPKGVGTSGSRSAEDTAKGEKEAGREDTGPSGGAGRPSGTSTARDVTGVAPQDPITRPADERSG